MTMMVINKAAGDRPLIFRSFSASLSLIVGVIRVCLM